MINENQVTLKLLRAKDYTSKYLLWMNDKRVTQFTEQRYTKHSKKKILKFIRDKHKSKNEFLFGIFLKNKNKKNSHVGNIKIGPINFIHKTSDISYFIGNEKYWGRNIATIAIKKILKIAKKKFKLKKITAGFYQDNLGSKRVLKKNGFLKEGELKNHLIYKNKRVSNFIYGKII